MKVTIMLEVMLSELLPRQRVESVVEATFRNAFENGDINLVSDLDRTDLHQQLFSIHVDAQRVDLSEPESTSGRVSHGSLPVFLRRQAD